LLHHPARTADRGLNHNKQHTPVLALSHAAFAEARDGWVCNMVIGEALRFGSSRDPGGNCQPSQRPLSPSRPRPARPNNDGQQNRCGACNIATVPTGSCLVMPLPPWDPIVRVAT